MVKFIHYFLHCNFVILEMENARFTRPALIGLAHALRLLFRLEFNIQPKIYMAAISIFIRRPDGWHSSLTSVVIKKYGVTLSQQT